jgi:hypothetical protein
MNNNRLMIAVATAALIAGTSAGFARRAGLDSRARRDQTGVAMRHNQSDSRKLSRASSGLYRPGRDVVDATRARAFSLRRMSACM